MIPNSAFSWGMQVWNACWHHRPKPLPEEGIDGSHNTPAGTAYMMETGCRMAWRASLQYHHQSCLPRIKLGWLLPWKCTSFPLSKAKLLAGLWKSDVPLGTIVPGPCQKKESTRATTVQRAGQSPLVEKSRLPQMKCRNREYRDTQPGKQFETPRDNRQMHSAQHSHVTSCTVDIGWKFQLPSAVWSQY